MVEVTQETSLKFMERILLTEEIGDRQEEARTDERRGDIIQSKPEDMYTKYKDDWKTENGSERGTDEAVPHKNVISQKMEAVTSVVLPEKGIPYEKPALTKNQGSKSPKPMSPEDKNIPLKKSMCPEDEGRSIQRQIHLKEEATYEITVVQKERVIPSQKVVSPSQKEAHSEKKGSLSSSEILTLPQEVSLSKQSTPEKRVIPKEDLTLLVKKVPTEDVAIPDQKADSVMKEEAIQYRTSQTPQETPSKNIRKTAEEGHSQKDQQQTTRKGIHLILRNDIHAIIIRLTTLLLYVTFFRYLVS